MKTAEELYNEIRCKAIARMGVPPRLTIIGTNGSVVMARELRRQWHQSMFGHKQSPFVNHRVLFDNLPSETKEMLGEE